MRTLVMDYNIVGSNKLRLANSIIGRYSMFESSREIYGEIWLGILDYSWIKLRKQLFAAELDLQATSMAGTLSGEFLPLGTSEGAVFTCSGEF